MCLSAENHLEVEIFWKLETAHGKLDSTLPRAIIEISPDGSAGGPVILPVFKTGARHLRGVVGVFDSHTLPPLFTPRIATIFGIPSHKTAYHTDFQACSTEHPAGT